MLRTLKFNNTFKNLKFCTFATYLAFCCSPHMFLEKQEETIRLSPYNKIDEGGMEWKYQVPFCIKKYCCYE